MAGLEPEPDTSVPAATWAVWRMDEDRCTSKVRGGLTHGEAYRVMGGLAVRGHGVRYWVESESADSHEQNPMKG